MKIVELVLYFLNGFHVQLAIAGLLFGRYLKLRLNRVAVVALFCAYCILPFLSQLLPFLPIDALATMPGIWGQSYYLVAIAFGVIYWLCFQFANLKEFLFCYIPAITIQHSLYDVNSILDHLWPTMPTLASSAVHLFVMLVVYLMVDIFFIWRLPKENGVPVIQSSYLIPFTFFAAFLVYGLSVWTRSNENFTYGGCLFDLISCILLLVVHFGKFTQSKLEREKELILQILQGSRKSIGSPPKPSK